MAVFVANEQEIAVDEARLAALARHTLLQEDVDPSSELSVLLVGADHMQRLNARFANSDHPTDVLAFPMNEPEDDGSDQMLGDVVVCPRVAEGNAAKFGHDLMGEMDVLIVHGTLHLLGYDHQGPDDKARMDKRMRHILDTFRLER